MRGWLCTSSGWLMDCCGVGGVVRVDWWVRGFVGWLLSLSIVYRLLGVGVVWMWDSMYLGGWLIVCYLLGFDVLCW